MEDLVPLVLGGMGIIVVMIPLAGFTLRYAIRPTVEPIVEAIPESRGRESMSRPDLEKRLALLQEDVDEIREAVKVLLANQRFDRELVDGGVPAKSPSERAAT